MDSSRHRNFDSTAVPIVRSREQAYAELVANPRRTSVFHCYQLADQNIFVSSHLLIASGLRLTARKQCSGARTASVDPASSGRPTAAHGCVDLQNAALAMQSADVGTPRLDVCVRA